MLIGCVLVSSICRCTDEFLEYLAAELSNQMHPQGIDETIVPEGFYGQRLYFVLHGTVVSAARTRNAHTRNTHTHTCTHACTPAVRLLRCFLSLSALDNTMHVCGFTELYFARLYRLSSHPPNKCWCSENRRGVPV